MFDRNEIDRMGGWSLPVSVFEWIFSNLSPGSKILELGSGKGSEVLRQEFEVISIENDERFVNDPSVHLVEIVPTPASTSRGQGGWFKRETLQKIIPEDYDLLIIDAPMRKIGRSGILDNLDLFRSDRPMIVDDINRYHEYEVAKSFSEILGCEMEILNCDVFKYRKSALLLP